MARKNTPPLDAGETFPNLQLSLVDGSFLAIPTGLHDPFNVVLITRGAWCPFCVGQLKAFQSGLGELNSAGIGVVSLSTDSLETARDLRDEHGLTFPIAYGSDVDAIAEALGNFYDPHPSHTAPYLQSTGFLLASGGKIINAVYSTGPIGRLVWQDVLGMVRYIKSHP
jgi:peroxiredoxin